MSLAKTKAFFIIAVAACILGPVTPVAAQTSYNVVAETDWSLGVGQPLGGVIKTSNGVFYGTGRGGSLGCGGVYKIALDGTFSVVHALALEEGCVPLGELVQGADGHLYGTTSAGGPNLDQAPGGTGTVFRISLPDETLSRFQPIDATTSASLSAGVR